ncbi:MAG: hypothetical protein NVSMB51_21720 [Solirubrobacteraceae bacterium]
MSSPEIELVRRLFHDWNDHGALPADELIAADFELHSPLADEHGEPFRGPQGAHRWAAELNERFPGFHFELEQLEQHGERILALGRLAVEGQGTAAGLSRAEGWVVDVQDQLITRIEVFTDRAAARESFAVRS